MKKPKPLPTFKTEAEERKFWETHDSTDYIDWSKAERVRLPNLKPSTTAISIRLPLALLEQIKIAANKRVSIADQDVAGGEGRMNPERHRPGLYLTATMKIRGNRSSTLSSACGR
jgi:predicted DNA binding CopG/RHH family protein